MSRVGSKFIFFVGLLLLMAIYISTGLGFASVRDDKKVDLKVGLLLLNENLMDKGMLDGVYEEGCRQVLGALFSEVVKVNNLEEISMFELPLYIISSWEYMQITPVSGVGGLDSGGRKSHERALVFTLYAGKCKLWSNAETIKKVSPLFAFTDSWRRAEIKAFNDVVERMTGALLDNHCLRDELSTLSGLIVKVRALQAQAKADEEVGDYPSALLKYSEILRLDSDCDLAQDAAERIESGYYVDSIDRALERGDLAVAASMFEELKNARHISGYGSNVRISGLERRIGKIGLFESQDAFFVPLEVYGDKEDSVVASENDEDNKIEESSLSEVWLEPETGMEFIRVNGGSFAMGSGISEVGRFVDEGPQHAVQVDGFWIGRYEVTNEQYQHFKIDHDSGQYKDRSLNAPRQPVVGVSWREAVAFADWLSAQGNGKFRLPSEAEWEYACRGGTLSPWFWGDDPVESCTYANLADQTARQEWPDWPVCECPDGKVENAPVGSFAANDFGLHDMLGNVWEWCGDRYGEKYYDRSSGDNPTGPSVGYLRVMRGGSWDVAAKIARCALRRPGKPDYRFLGLGLRLVRVE